MIDRNRLQTKLALQKIRNMMSTVRGIVILDYEENPFSEEYLQKIGYLNNSKEADLKIPYSTNANEIAAKICDRMNIKDSQIWYYAADGFLVKFRVTDPGTAVLDIFDKTTPNSKGFVLIDENKDTMYDFGSDSRDEENYLFDKYSLN
ncbi:hypothetical protein [Ruminococcus albus]|uniref:Uncharacterized protein n=1 Tax=Ruminococcus albus TaxID=1264 RepID=A0A1I1DUI0_RUMAL|nr:hypothetical protein [Ruminococcus albus]SFB76223.1 hypothetical protein SAMN02910406_00433 [Ruminococcus albus]